MVVGLSGLRVTRSQRPSCVSRAGARRLPCAKPAHGARVDVANATLRSSGYYEKVNKRLSVRARAATEDVEVSKLDEMCTKALRSLGYSADEAAVLTEVMMYAQIRGNNQGIIKITTGAMARAPGAGPIVLEHETRLSALINGNGDAGMLVLSRAADLASQKATKNGFGIVGTNGTSTSTGALAYYANKMANSGLIAVVLAQSPEFVAPAGAREAIFGTNPICIGVPTEEGAVVMDMATAAYAWFGVLEAKTANEQLPAGVAMDASGVDTTDPDAVLNGGALKVFDGSYKGSALALMVELLAGPLVGAAVADKLDEKNWGNLVLALDPSLLQDATTFRARVQQVVDRVKHAARQPGVEEIFLPGERSAARAAQTAASGVLAVERNLLQGLSAMAAEFDAGHSLAASGRSDGWGLGTRLVHPLPAGNVDPYDSMGPPLYQTATFKQPGALKNGEFDYTRSGNPTRRVLEANVAALESGVAGLAFTSGMAAIAAVCRLVKNGEHIVAGDDIYGGTSRLLAQVCPGMGISVSNIDHTDLEVYARAFQANTKLVMLESPTNPRMQVCDLQALTDIAHQHGAIVMVDNSIMTPMYQRPLELGADISMISATKFIGGHSDVTGGILSFKDADLAKQVYFFQNAEGTGLPPFECWLASRGLKTMKIRMDKAVQNAGAIAQFLASHPLVSRVNYAGLPGTAAAALNAQQATSGGSLLSFTTDNVDVSQYIAEKTELFSITVSFGSTSSLISLPCYMSHASIPADVRAARGLPDDLVRISAGIEDTDDLIDDLRRTFDAAMTDLEIKPSAEARSRASTAATTSSGVSVQRERALLQRIEALEAALASRNGAGTPGAGSHTEVHSS